MRICADGEGEVGGGEEEGEERGVEGVGGGWREKGGEEGDELALEGLEGGEGVWGEGVRVGEEGCEG